MYQITVKIEKTEFIKVVFKILNQIKLLIIELCRAHEMEIPDLSQISQNDLNQRPISNQVNSIDKIYSLYGFIPIFFFKLLIAK